MVEDIALEQYRPKFPGQRPDLICPDCGAPMVLRETKKFPRPFYGCTRFPECKGKHGATETGAPAGIPANSDTRAGRRWIMRLLEKKRGIPIRTIIRDTLGLPSDARIGVAVLDNEQCELVIKALYRTYPELLDRYSTLLYDEEFLSL